MEIFQVLTFEAAHLLPNLPEGHKCRRLHGHSFKVEVTIQGPIDKRLGWVMDFNEIEQTFQSLKDQLDHRYLNDIEGLENPTTENLARWIWRRLQVKLPSLSRLVIFETCTAGCVYRGEDE